VPAIPAGADYGGLHPLLSHQLASLQLILVHALAPMSERSPNHRSLKHRLRRHRTKFLIGGGVVLAALILFQIWRMTPQLLSMLVGSG
jgi:hypothetical protein